MIPRQALRHLGGFPEGPDPVGAAVTLLAQTGPVVHVPRPMIHGFGPTCRPVLGFPGQDPSPGRLSLLMVAEKVDKELLVFLAGLRDQGVDGLELVLIVPPHLIQPASILSGKPPWVDIRVLAMPGQLGLSQAYNLAKSRARGRYLLVCRPGERFAPGSLELLAKALDANPGVSFVAGTLGRRVSGSPVPGGEPQALRLRDMLMSRRHLAGVMYRARVHGLTGPFLEYPGRDTEWDMLVRLAEAQDGLAVPGALVLPGGDGSGDAPPNAELSARMIIGRAAERMNYCLNLMKLYWDVFIGIDATTAMELVANRARAELLSSQYGFPGEFPVRITG